MNNNLYASRAMTKPLAEVNALPSQNRAGEQALYAVAARHFLDASRVYLAIPYTGSRRWYPNSGVFRMSSSGFSRPEQVHIQGEKHVVG
jgi:hypothetical protein